jgi:uncharacterized repeat protein (TIGR02059 family)
VANVWNSDFQASWPGRRIIGFDSWNPAAGSTIDTQLNNNNFNFHIVSSPTVPQWGSAGEFKMRSTDKLNDGRYAVLLGAGNTSSDRLWLNPGDDYYIACWFQLAADTNSSIPLLWEWHHQGTLYNLGLPNGGVVPNAIACRNSNLAGFSPRPGDGFLPPPSPVVRYLTYMLNAGNASSGTLNPKHWALTPINPGTIHKMIVRIKLSDTSGVVQIWLDSATGQNPGSFSQSSPLVNYAGPTNMWAASNGVPAGLRLFGLTGIYNGTTQPSGTIHAYSGGMGRAFTTFAEAAAVFGEGSPPPPSDTTAPSLVGVVGNGDTIVLEYGEALDASSVPVVGDFTVLVNGSARSVSSVSLSGTRVTLTLAAPLVGTDTVTLSYNRVTGREIQDVSNNASANLSLQAVDNQTPLGVRTRTIARTRLISRTSNPAGRIRFGLMGERGALSINDGLGTTQAIPVTQSCGAGNTIVLIFAGRCTSAASISVADSRGNTWTVDGGPANGSNNLVLIASTRQDADALQAGDSVTVTFGTAPQQSRMAVLEEFAGLLTTSYVDKTATATSASATSLPTGTTAATTQADELAVAAWNLDGISEVDISGFDSTYQRFPTYVLAELGVTDGYVKAYVGQYKILSATGAQAATITRPTAGSYQGMIVTYKADSAGGVVSPGGGI